MEIITTYFPIWISLLAGVIAVGIGFRKKDPKIISILIIILSLAGVAMLVDLAYVHYSGASSVCDINESVSCNTVNTSEYSEVLGIPIAFFGIGYFLAAIALALRKKKRDTNAALIVLMTILAIIPALYLSAIEYLIIQVVCPFCEASKVLMLAIAALAWPAAKRTGLVTDKAVAGLVLLGVAGSAFTYLLQTKTHAADADYTPLVSCLKEEGVSMYGSVTCAHCAAQRRVLGEDAILETDLEIECDPRGINAETQRCLEKDILETPTWLQEDAEGNELDRVSGIQSPEQLADRFGCADALLESL